MDTAIFGRLVLPCIVHEVHALVETVSLDRQLLLGLFDFALVQFDLLLSVGEFLAKVLDLAILVILNQLELIM